MQDNPQPLLTPRVLSLIPLAVGINLAMGQFAAVTHVPLFLDTVGTVVVAALAGPWVAVLTGLVSQITFTVVSGNSTWLAFLPVQLAVAIYAGYAARLGAFTSLSRALLGGVGLGFVAATISWPISLILFGGVTAGGVTLVTTVLRGLGVPLEWAVLAASLSNDLLDKSVTFLLVRAVLAALPRRLAAAFPEAGRSLGR
jgi:energy-coupling factor transport system substrate-specific component